MVSLLLYRAARFVRSASDPRIAPYTSRREGENSVLVSTPAHLQTSSMEIDAAQVSAMLNRAVAGGAIC